MLHPVVTEMSVPRLRGKGPLMGDKHGELSGALKVLVYSDDHAVREQVKVALTGMIAPDLRMPRSLRQLLRPRWLTP